MKYILLLLLCLSNYCGYSQVFRLRAFSSHLALLDEKGDEISNKDLWAQSTDFVVINMDKQKVQVYGNKDIDIDLMSRDIPRKDSDKISFDFTGVDKNGDKCSVTVIVYTGIPETHVATLVISYAAVKLAMIYRLKRSD